jgi:hypothetical protein
MSAAVAIALHTFHVTRAFLAWQTGTLESERAERSLQIFSQSDRMRDHPCDAHKKTSLRPVKIQNYFTGYIKTGNARLYFNKHPKNLKHSAPQKKTCLPGEGKDRENDPHPRIGSSCRNGAWIHNSFGRWNTGPNVPSIRKLRDKLNTGLEVSGMGRVAGVSCR